MRVAIFTDTFLPKIDGIVTIICLLIDHLETRGIQTAIVAPKLGIERYKNSPIIGVPGVRMPLYPELTWGPPTFGTYRQVKAFQPDLAHFIHPALIGGFGLLMASRLRIASVASFHLDYARLVHHFNIGFIEPGADWLTRILFNWADYALAPSRLIQQDMLRLGIRRVGLWRRGVDAVRFNPAFRSAEMRAYLSGGQPDDTLLLYVGRLSTEKKLESLRDVLGAVPGTRLALIGDGPARPALEAHFAGTNTLFTGYLQGEALSQAYASADVFVFPSALETFGLVVLEAFASGIPVVAARVGGVPVVVDEGRTGYTFAVGDTAALIDGVRQIAASRDRMSAMGQAARAYAEAQSWPAIMDEVVDLYAQLIAARKARRR